MTDIIFGVVMLWMVIGWAFSVTCMFLTANGEKLFQSTSNKQMAVLGFALLPCLVIYMVTWIPVAWIWNTWIDNPKTGSYVVYNSFNSKRFTIGTAEYPKAKNARKAARLFEKDFFNGRMRFEPSK